MLNDPNFTALGIMALFGAVVGLVGGLAAGAKSLGLVALMGAMGAVAAAAVARVSGLDPIVSIGDDYSFVYGAVGGLVLSYAVGRSDRR